MSYSWDKKRKLGSETVEEEHEMDDLANATAEDKYPDSSKRMGRDGKWR